MRPKRLYRFTNPIEINIQIVGIKMNKMPNFLLRLIHASSQDFDGINFSTSWNALAKAPPIFHERIKSDYRFLNFINETSGLMGMEGDFFPDVQPLSNIIHAIAKLDVDKEACEGIISAIVEKGDWIAARGKSQEVANTAWAFARLEVDAPAFFAALDRRGEWLADEVNTQEAGNIAWALAKARIDAPTFFNALEGKGKWIVESGKAQEISNIYWAFANLKICGRGVVGKNFFGAVEKDAERLVELMNPQECSNVAWAIAE